jgi:hypothetical protein
MDQHKPLFCLCKQSSKREQNKLLFCLCKQSKQDRARQAAVLPVQTVRVRESKTSCCSACANSQKKIEQDKLLFCLHKQSK